MDGVDVRDAARGSIRRLLQNGRDEICEVEIRRIKDGGADGINQVPDFCSCPLQALT